MNSTNILLLLVSAMLPSKTPFRLLPTKASSPYRMCHLPFATSFIFSVAPCKDFHTAHGFAFVLSPVTVMGTSRETTGNYMGLLNCTKDGDSSTHIYFSY
ncbi:hypothetical protein K1719_030289 [Acacia pycnantha]|nr:hypothetical protein K1719_030289 [Acacia pycnantha]